jgi:hypothetical protein
MMLTMISSPTQASLIPPTDFPASTCIHDDDDNDDDDDDDDDDEGHGDCGDDDDTDDDGDDDGDDDSPNQLI